MEDGDYEFGEVEGNASAIRPEAIMPQATVPTEQPQQKTSFSLPQKPIWQYEVSKDPYEDPPLFSQLRYHIIVKNLYGRSIDNMREDLAEEYRRKLNARAKNIFIKLADATVAGSSNNGACAYVGFQYDYEAFKVINSGNKIDVPLYSKQGERGTPDFLVTDMFNYLIQKVGPILEQQARARMGGERKKSISDEKHDFKEKPLEEEYKKGHNLERQSESERRRKSPHEIYASPQHEKYYHHRSRSREEKSKSRSPIRKSQIYEKRSPPHSEHRSDRHFGGQKEKSPMKYQRKYSRSRSISYSRSPRREKFEHSRSPHEMPIRQYSRSHSREEYQKRGEPMKTRRPDEHYEKYEQKYRSHSRSRSGSNRPLREFRPKESSKDFHEDRRAKQHHFSDSPPASNNYPQNTQQLEEGEIPSKYVNKTCYVFGIPYKTTIEDISKEISRRGLYPPKSIDTLKKGIFYKSFKNRG